MRFLHVLFSDIRYQVQYGFYFLYTIISAVYIVLLHILPESVRQAGTAVIIWSDPAVLGFIFIGGIILLEKGEGLHSYLSVMPVTIMEYIIAKVLSLSLISVVAGVVIATVALQGQVNYAYLLPGLLLGSALFTLLGMIIGTAARSVNHFLLISIPVIIVFTAPSVLILFSVSHPIADILPGILMLRVILTAVGFEGHQAMLSLILLAAWLFPLYSLAIRRFTGYLLRTGG